MDFMFDISGLAADEEKFSDSKRDVLKFLKIIGVDTRFISYTPEKIYINNLRFSKFSRTREATFNRQYPDIEAKSAKKLTLDIKPNSRIMMAEDNFICEVLLEPYTRKYGVELVYEGDYDLIVNPIVLDDEVNNIFSSIFAGDGIEFRDNSNEIYPLINVPLEWINTFLQMDGRSNMERANSNDLAISFSQFLEEVAPQYKENVVSASEYIALKQKNSKAEQ